MKKVFISIAVMLIALCASAQNNMTPEQMQMMMQMMQMMQKSNSTTEDGYSTEEIQQTRVEKRQFEDSNKLRAIGEDESREKQSARDIAEVAARAQMQRQIESFVKNGLERYRKETQMDDAEKFQANDEQLAQTVSKGIQSGCKVIDYAVFYNKTTKKYKCQVLVEYDKQGVLGLIEAQEEAIMRNRDKFESHMQNVFDEYEMDKTGTTTAMRKQAAMDAQEEERLDRQAQRDARARQQEADNALRQQESNQNYNLSSQKQHQDTAKQMQKQKIDGEIMKGNARNQKTDY